MDHHAVFFRKRDGQVLPMDQILTDGVAPTHVAPGVIEWVVLVEQVIFAAIVDGAVRIVGPVLGRTEVKAR